MVKVPLVLELFSLLFIGFDAVSTAAQEAKPQKECQLGILDH
jgi:hypothetical protein